MEQYISKSALVAEIKRRRDYYKRNPLLVNAKYCIDEDNAILKLLDTLEVKEVDLVKESELIANGIMIGVQGNKYHTCIYNPERCDFNHSHLMLAARKGIELGLKAKGE